VRSGGGKATVRSKCFPKGRSLPSVSWVVGGKKHANREGREKPKGAENLRIGQIHLWEEAFRVGMARGKLLVTSFPGERLRGSEHRLLKIRHLEKKKDTLAIVIRKT